MKPKQLFFSAADSKQAWAAAVRCNEDLYAIIDKRSKAPSDRMYVLTTAALIQMQNSKLWRRMWVPQHLVWKESGQ